MFLETEKLIARCIQRTNEIELESEEEVTKQSEKELNIQSEVTAVTNIKVILAPTGAQELLMFVSSFVRVLVQVKFV